VLLLGALLLAPGPAVLAGTPARVASASSSQAGFEPGGAVNGERFSAEAHCAWKGSETEPGWWWQIEFPRTRRVGAILQVQGDHDFVLRNAPSRYVWQTSLDGAAWSNLAETQSDHESRVYRLHRLRTVRQARFLRLRIDAVTGSFPTLREVEVYSRPDASIPFPDWIVVVNTTHDPALPNHGQEFIPVVRSCAGWNHAPAQQVWLDSFNESFLAIEPRPLCAFLSGNFKDWCEVERERWRGVQEVLTRGRLPMWASCGGAQGLAILAETGVDQPWDCPHCRDPQHPRLPIYTHIGHTAQKPCGDYSGCVFERGAFRVRPVTGDAVFRGLPDEFEVMESHCGQIEWAPRGWEVIARGGEGALTRNQCLRVRDRPIYAAQFHVELPGREANGQQIVSNFLWLAKAWGGYAPRRAAKCRAGRRRSRREETLTCGRRRVSLLTSTATWVTERRESRPPGGHAGSRVRS
jgi:hypothetical protein